MVEEAVETRIKSSPSLGAKISLLIAALFVVAAVYHMVVPLQIIANNGGNFDCRSAIQGPRTTLAKSTCSDVYTIATTKSIALGAAALVMVIGGFLTFGLDRREQRIVVRRYDDDDLDGHESEPRDEDPVPDPVEDPTWDTGIAEDEHTQERVRRSTQD